MFEIVKAGGWVMAPLIACSVMAAAIILERLWTLQPKRVVPADLADKVWSWVEKKQLDERHIRALHDSSPLGQVLAAGLAKRHKPRALIKESIEDTGRHVVHELERFLNSLGTIASIAPLLGLLGTVIGMIRTFNAVTEHGVGDPAALAGGIAQALITTVAGLCVAIPAVAAYRYLHGRVDSLVIQMEKEAMRLVEALEADQEKAIAL
jgi:biopolymer transport protein ExbB